MNSIPAAYDGDEPARGAVKPGALRRRLAELAQLPLGVRAGLTTLTAGVLIDLLAHALGGADTTSHHTAPEHFAHLVALAGMAIVLAGVVLDGAGRQRLAGARRRTREGEPHDASR